MLVLKTMLISIKPQKCVEMIFFMYVSTIDITRLLAKTKIFRQTLFLNIDQSLLELFAM